MKLIQELLVLREKVGDRKPKVHHFDSLGDAYDQSQYMDEINDGDVLVAPGSVAILLQAWPTLVKGTSEEAGKNVFHVFKKGTNWETVEGGAYKDSYELAMKQKMKPARDYERESLDWFIKGAKIGDEVKFKEDPIGAKLGDEARFWKNRKTLVGKIKKVEPHSTGYAYVETPDGKVHHIHFSSVIDKDRPE